MYLYSVSTTDLKGRNNQHAQLTSNSSNLRTKETNKKSIVAKERDRKTVKGKIAQPIRKQNKVKTTLIDLTSATTEMKKMSNSQRHSPIFMTTIDTDGIKSVTLTSKLLQICH